jgi:hypothetical protein
MLHLQFTPNASGWIREARSLLPTQPGRFGPTCGSTASSPDAHALLPFPQMQPALSSSATREASFRPTQALRNAREDDGFDWKQVVFLTIDPESGICGVPVAVIRFRLTLLRIAII